MRRPTVALRAGDDSTDQGQAKAEALVSEHQLGEETDARQREKDKD